MPRQTGEPLADWLERTLAEPALADLRAPLREMLRLHYQHRFDPPCSVGGYRDFCGLDAAGTLQGAGLGRCSLVV